MRRGVEAKTWAMVALMLLLFGAGFASPAQAAPVNHVVISQVYGGGGSFGATYMNDYIELFNPSTTDILLSGWSLQYASVTGNFGSATGTLTMLGGTIGAGRYLLVQEAQGAGGTTLLPTPDLIDAPGINLSATGAKLALVSTSTSLDCNGASTPCSDFQLATIVDLVGWGEASFFEGAGAGPATSNITALFRADGGCTDTDNNSADFATGAPNPRNGLLSHTCASTSPEPGAIPAPASALLFVFGLAGVITCAAWLGSRRTSSRSSVDRAPEWTRRATT